MSSRRGTHRFASLVPFGLGLQKPHHYLEMLRVAWTNRDQPRLAWRILTKGVCDGCALGTSGLSDWTIPGVHLCMVRLELLRLNTVAAFDTRLLADAASLTQKTSSELRAFGRIPAPLLRRAGERGFREVAWDEALDLAASELQRSDPQRVAFYLTSRGLTNEAYYGAQKAARFYGTSNVDNAARLCHAASTVAMRSTLGHGASTCSYSDWIGADLIVFFGANTPNNQPVTTKYLYEATKRGTEIAVVNPHREPGFAAYWVPSAPASALFGTKLADHWFEVDTGGDLSFLIGVFRALVEAGAVDRPFIEAQTEGFVAASLAAQQLDWSELERHSGASRQSMEAFARLLASKPNTVFVWSMGLAQHAHGTHTVQALINVGLARGLLGRPHRGLMPIRGHSGVQGGAEVGCVNGVDAKTLEHWEQVWGFPVPRRKGYTAAEMVEAAADGALDVFWIVGGNFLETLPDESRVRQALARPGLRVHHDIVVSSSMLVEPESPDGAVLVLPATTRYEAPGGGTETTTERRIVFSPEIAVGRIPAARTEWDVLGEVMARVRPERAGAVRFGSAAAMRREIARAIPLYAGIEQLAAQGDQVQWGGRQLYAHGVFATPDGRAHFTPLTPVARPRAEEQFFLSTRRGKQFNSMVQKPRDPLTGAARDAVLMSRADAERLNVSEGDRVELVSTAGEFRGRVTIAPIKPGNLEVHWPEGNVLIPGGHVDPESGEPDYNAVVTVSRE